MAGKDFDRVVINTRERPLSSDMNQQASQEAQVIRDVLNKLQLGKSGFFLDGFYCVGTANPLEVSVTAGMGFISDPSAVGSNIGGVGGVNEVLSMIPVNLQAAQLLTLAAAPGAAQERYDLIEVRDNRHFSDNANRDVLDPVSGNFTSTAVNKTLSYDIDGNVGTVISPAASTAALSVKQGVVAGTGAAVVPSVTPGYKAIAVVYVPNGATTLTGKIQDMRYLLTGGPATIVTLKGQITIGAPDTVTLCVQPVGAGASVRGGFGPQGGPNGMVFAYFLMGDVTGRTFHGLSVMARNVGAGPTDVVARMLGNTAPFSASNADATALRAAPNSVASAAVGQTYALVQVEAFSASGAPIGAGAVIEYVVTGILA